MSTVATKQKSKKVNKVTESLTIKKTHLREQEYRKKIIDIMSNPTVPYYEGLALVENELKEAVREISFNYQINGFLEDTCYALHRAVDKVHGFTKMQNNSSASKENPPEMIDVKFADGSRIKVPYGTINLPQFGETAFIKMAFNPNKNALIIQGVCEKRYTSLMDEIISEAERFVSTDSIYRNKAIKYDGSNSPEFMDLSGVEKTEIFLTRTAKFATEPIEARIEKTDECIANGIDLKFGVLLEGNYGTGKTLYANKLALLAIKNGWTFIYCSRPEKTLEALKMSNNFTKNGRGVVLFVEDVDKILSDRNNITNEISLLMDGSETKHNNIISIFSTNHIENIDPTFLRGKRIGSIVTLEHLDADTAEKMFKHYLGEYLSGGCANAAQKAEEFKIVPAFLSEIIDRVKTHRVLRGTDYVSENDLLDAILQFKRQMDIATVKTNVETDEAIFMRLFKDFSNTKSDDDNELVNTIKNYLIDAGYEFS